MAFISKFGVNRGGFRISHISVIRQVSLVEGIHSVFIIGYASSVRSHVGLAGIFRRLITGSFTFTYTFSSSHGVNGFGHHIRSFLYQGSFVSSDRAHVQGFGRPSIEVSHYRKVINRFNADLHGHIR